MANRAVLKGVRDPLSHAGRRALRRRGTGIGLDLDPILHALCKGREEVVLSCVWRTPLFRALRGGPGSGSRPPRSGPHDPRESGGRWAAEGRPPSVSLSRRPRRAGRSAAATDRRRLDPFDRPLGLCRTLRASGYERQGRERRPEPRRPGEILPNARADRALAQLDRRSNPCSASSTIVAVATGSRRSAGVRGGSARRLATTGSRRRYRLGRASPAASVAGHPRS